MRRLQYKNEQITVLFLSLVFQFVQSHFQIRPVQYNIQHFHFKRCGVCYWHYTVTIFFYENNDDNRLSQCSGDGT